MKTHVVVGFLAAGFDAFKEELGPSRDSTLPRGVSLDVSYDEQDIMKVSVSITSLRLLHSIHSPAWRLPTDELQLANLYDLVFT